MKKALSQIITRTPTYTSMCPPALIHMPCFYQGSHTVTHAMRPPALTHTLALTHTRHASTHLCDASTSAYTGLSLSHQLKRFCRNGVNHVMWVTLPSRMCLIHPRVHRHEGLPTPPPEVMIRRSLPDCMP